MRKILGLVTLLVGLALLHYLNNPVKIGKTPIPPLGKLLNPYSGVWQNAEDPEDYSDIDLTSNLVKDEIKIVFDDRMVPHIYAQNLEDAIFAQGYVEAYHRLFQMDLSTRSPDGRLSEILGERLLAYDKKQRRLGLGFGADNAVEGWQAFPEKLKIVDQYTAGVNHFISNLDPSEYPMEYKLLDFKPSAWTNRHSALLLKAMSQTLVGYEEDVEMSNALRLLGSEDFDLVYPDRNPKDTPVTKGPSVNTIKFKSQDKLQDIVGINIPSISRPRSPDGVGSNNWAISGSKSETGLPILANDPHLGLSLPSVWYEIAITTPEFSAQGVTLLGMPGIMIGFNENIAWGETNVGHDMMDYYKINWVDSTKMSYLVDGKAVPADLKVEEYYVSGLGKVTDTVRYTIWGPIVDDSTDLALRWVAHDKPDKSEFMAFVDGMRSENYDEYLKATAQFYAPAQNFIYADNNNDIGLRINGNIPIKKYRQGVTVSDGSNMVNGWQGYIPRELNPQERNPEKGFVTSCNQYSAAPDYPYYYNGNFEPYRGRMANRLLYAKDTFSIADFKAMQNSNYSILAEEALQVLMPLLDSNFHKLSSVKKLARWDYQYAANSKNAVLFDLWFESFHRLLWDEVYNKSDELNLPNPDVWVTVNLIEADKTSKFYDIVRTTKVETLKELVNLSFEQIKDSAIVTLAEEKNAQILHLTRLPAFSEMNLALGGTKHSLNAMQQTFGPSWRMVVALGEDEPEAYGIYPGGQSGNPASPFYKDRIKTWANGEYDRIILAPREEKIESPLFNIVIRNEE